MIDQDSACGEYESKLLWKMVISTADGSLAAVDNQFFVTVRNRE